MLDPYHKWLGIREPERPPNHYRLLGIDLFESDPDVIATAADRQMAHLRRYQTGPHVALSQSLLNEVAAARICLLQPDAKQKYDQRLRQSVARPTAPTGIRVVPDLPDVTRAAGRRRSPAAWRMAVPLALVALGLAPTYWLGGDLLRFVGRQGRGQGDRAVRRDDAQGASAGAPLASEQPSADAAPGEMDLSAGRPAPDSGGPSLPSTEIGVESATTGANIASSDAVVVPSASLRTREELRPATAPTLDGLSKDSPPTSPPIDASDPWFPVLMSARERDLKAAWDRWRQLAAAAQTPTDRWQAESRGLCLGRLTAFWAAVESGRAAVAVGDSLELPQGSVTVAAVAPEEITVRAADGTTHTFSTESGRVAAPLAESLARHAYWDRPALVDAMAATFWEIDAQGDVLRAASLAALARSQGLAVSPWTAETPGGLPQRARSADSAGDPNQPAVSAAVEPEGSDPAGPGGTWTLPTRSLAAGDRLAVPDEAALIDATARIRESDADYLTEPKLPAEQAVRARVWLAEAGRRLADPPARYLLLTKARELALASADVDTAWEATEKLGLDYEVDVDELRSDSFRQLARRVTARRDQLVLAECALGAIHDGIHRHAFDAAQELADQLVRIVRRTKATSLIAHASHLTRDIPAVRLQYESLAERWGKGWSAEDRAAAHQAIGEYLLYYARDGAAAVNYLADGTDATLSRLSQRELARGAGGVEERLALMDEWWTHAENLKGLPARSVLHYVGSTYMQLLPELAGLERKRVEKRLQQLMAAGELTQSQLLLQGIIDQVWKVDWSAAQPAWQRIVFLDNGTIEIQSQGKRAQHAWQRNVASIEILGSSGAHQIFLYPVSRQQLSGKKFDAKSGRHLCDGVGWRLAAF